MNADDFGLTVGINDAIIDTFNCGSVSSTTLMVNTPATEDAASKAQCHPGLGVGLHFNITLGRPITAIEKIQTLVDSSGQFYSRAVLARRVLMQRVKKAELELELDAQWQLMNQLGLRPTHIDSHQHIHSFPLCFDAVANLCRLEDVPMRMPWVLNPERVQVPIGRSARQWLLKWLLARNARRWSGLVRWNTGLGSIFDLGSVPGQMRVEHYRTLLDSAPEGVFELMVHPARVAAELTGLTQIGDISEHEWRFLMSGDLPHLISELGFTLGNYRTLLHA